MTGSVETAPELKSFVLESPYSTAYWCELGFWWKGRLGVRSPFNIQCR